MKRLLLSLGLLLALFVANAQDDFPVQRVELLVKAGSTKSNFKVKTEKGIETIKVRWADGKTEEVRSFDFGTTLIHDYAPALDADGEVWIDATNLIEIEAGYTDASLMGIGTVDAPKLKVFNFFNYKSTLKGSKEGKVDLSRSPLLEVVRVYNAPDLLLPAELPALKTLSMNSDFKEDSEIYAAMKRDEMDFSGMPNLVTLDLMNQKIRKVKLGAMDKLESLMLSSCQIEEIQGVKELVKKSSVLTSLNISYNFIGIHQLPLKNSAVTYKKFDIKQRDYKIAADKIKGPRVDLSAMAEVADNEGNVQKTTFAVKKNYSTVDPSLYTEEKGVFTFKEELFKSRTTGELEDINISFTYENPLFDNKELVSFGVPKTETITVSPQKKDTVEAMITFSTNKNGETVYPKIESDGDFTIEGMTAKGENVYTINADKVTLKGSFVKLALNDMGITDIQLANQQKLVKFSAEFNELTTLDLSGAPNLIEINAPCNKLTSINLEKNSKLETILLYSNEKLAAINTANAPALKELYVSTCAIKSLDLTKNKELIGVDLYANKVLDELKLSDHPNLSDLLVADNALTTLNLEGCKNLSQLVIGRNHFTALHLDGFDNLTTLDASINSITEVTITNCPQLESVKLYANRLKALDATALPALSRLEVEMNKLTSLAVGANNKLICVSLFDNELSTEAMGQFVEGIGKPFDIKRNPFIVLVDTTIEEKNSYTSDHIIALRKKNWRVYDYAGGHRIELIGNETAAEKLQAVGKAYIANDTLIVRELAVAGATLYNESGKAVLFVDHEYTDVSHLPSGVYILINGKVKSKLIR